MSPVSPLGMTSPLSQLPTGISPQTHSQLVQQQTLQAAAAAAAAASSSSPVTYEQQPHPQQSPQVLPPLQQLQAPPLALPVQTPVTITPHTAVTTINQIQLQQPQPQQSQNISQQIQSIASTFSQTNTLNPTPSTRTITIPSQGTVKLSLASSTSNSGAGIPSGTHKVRFWFIFPSALFFFFKKSLFTPMSICRSLLYQALLQASCSDH